MNEELMQKNLEENRFQSAGIVDNIISLGIANPILENTVRNALAKDSSAAFQYAMNNGGIYQNNTFMGGNGLYGIARKWVPKKWKNGKNYNIGNLGPLQYNKFSAGSLDANSDSPISKLKTNIEANAPNIDTDSDIIATGFGFQKKAYSDFFNKLDSIGFKLDQARSPEVNLNEKQYKMYKDMTYETNGFFDLPNYNRKDYSYIDDNYKKILKTEESIDSYVDGKFEFRKKSLTEKMNKIESENYDAAKKQWKSKAAEEQYHSVEEKLNKWNKKAESVKSKMYDEKTVVDFIESTSHIKDGGTWTPLKLSGDFYAHFGQQVHDIAMQGDDLFTIAETTTKNGKKRVVNLTNSAIQESKILQDAIDLEDSIHKISNWNSNISKAYKEHSKKYLNNKYIKKISSEYGVGYTEAKKIATAIAKEEFIDGGTFLNHVASLGDEVGRIFASKTAFQKFMGNGVTKVLTGIQSGISATAWQLPLMIATAVASTNQENSIQNFVASYLYNPKMKELYQSSGVNRSMQISQNIHYSNLQDTQNIIIKHNTAERYLNDLDPINIGLDYSQKSFDLNPRNE